MARLCIVTGLQSEAARLPRPTGSDSPEIFVAGSDVPSMIERVRRSAAGGCDGILSFGIAGGLAPDGAVGNLIVPDGVMSTHGDSAPVDQGWRDLIRGKLADPNIHLRGGAILSAPAVVATPGEKAALHAETGAFAVDMESYPAAVVAVELNVPFIAIRVLTDIATQALPTAFDNAVNRDGTSQRLAVMMRLLVRPWEIADAVRVTRAYWKGLAVLRRAALLCGPQFGLGDLLD